MTQIACGMIGFRRGVAAGLMAAGLLAIASPSAAQLGPPPPPRAASAKPGDQKVLLNWKVPLPEHYADWDGPAVRHYEYRVRPEGGVFPSTWTRIPEYTGRVGGGLDERYAVEKLANGTPLSNGTSYFFEMRSENARGEGEATDEFSSTPVANTPATFEMTDETFTSGPSGIIVPRVPAVLLANLVGDIDDAEGIQIATGLDDRYTWQWQWIRVKDGVETEIPHATATGAPAGGYTLTPADVGSEIKARMRFRDDAYNQEEWVSPPTPTILPAALCRAPNLEGGRTLLGSDQIRLVQLDQEGQSQLRVGSAQGSFTLGGYGFSAVYHAIEGPEAGQLVLKLESQVNDTDQRQLALHVCEEVYPLYGDEIQINRSLPFTPRDNFRWPNSTDWSDLVTRTIHLSRDTAPPRLASVVFSEPPRNDFSPSLFIAFDEKLGDPDPVVADFTVEVDGSAVELNGGEFRTPPEGIRLTLAEPLPAAYSSLTVAYTKAAGHFVIQDPPGNRTPDFKVSVPYRRTPPPPPPPPPTNAPPPPTNAPPLAVVDAAQTAEDTPVTIAVLANDSDPDGDPLTVAGVSEPAHGTAVLTETGAVRYTPEPNFNGTDRFTYVVGDGSGLTAQAAVDVTVLPVNDPPEAVDDAAETAEDTPVTIAVLANDSDPEGDPLTVAEVSAPAHGTAVLTEAGTVQYAPEPDYHGPDRFTYVVGDGSGLTAQAAVEVTVLPVNDPPEAVDDAAETAEDTPVTIAVLANDSDPEGDPLTVAEVSAPAHGTAVLTEAGTVQYAPEPDYHGPDRFTYVVSSGSGLTARAAVEVTVLPVNDPPEAVDDAAETTEDTPVTIAVLANDSDPEGDPLTVAEISTPAHGAARLTGAGAVEYTPDPDYHGPDGFTYVVGDGSGLTAQAAVDVTVLPANDPPEVLGVIPDQTLEAGDGPASLDLSPYFEDRDGDSLGYTAVASDAVALSLAGATLTLTVARPGAATVMVTAQDPGGLTAAQAFLVTTSDRQARGVVEDTLAAMGRGHLASARATLGRRAAATGREESRITVAGMHVPLGTDNAAAAGRALAERWITGLAGGMPPPGAGWPGMGPAGPGAFGLAGRGLGGAGGAPGGAAGPGRRGAGTSSAFSGLSPFAGRGQTEFQLALGEEAGDGSEPGRRWTVWGQLDVQAFQGGRSPASRYDGALRTAYVGVDARLGERWLAGVAVTRSNADGDWSFGSSTGRLTTQLTSLQPYLRWSDGGTSIWATAGGGRGSAENERTRYGLQEESGLGLRMGLVEVRRRLATVGPGVELALRGDVSWARLATAEGGELIDALEADVHQLRVGVDVSRLLRTAGGTSVEPFGEVHARHDGGSGQTGAGLEVAGGLRVARGVFRVEGMGRLLGLHAAESYREHGAAVTLSVGEGARRPGLTLSLSPRWGAPATASDALWRDQLFHQQTPGGPVAGRDEGALDTRVHYGLQLPSGGLLTPFGLYGRSPYGQRLQAGLLLDRLGPLGLEVSGERHALPQQGRDEYRMTVLGSITFGGPDGAPARRSGAP